MNNHNIAQACDVPPLGWTCTRNKGHEGPCAASKSPSQKESLEALIEAVDRVLDEGPCDCSDHHRYEKGEHLSGCYLFDLNAERARLQGGAA